MISGSSPGRLWFVSALLLGWAAQASDAASCVWKVSSPSGATLYLGGSAHALRSFFVSAAFTDNIEVVQSQDATAAAELDYISSVFAHNVAKLSLARALGGAADKVERFLKLK